MRIGEHPVLSFRQGKEIHFSFDGKDVVGYEGDTIVSALHALGIWTLSQSAVYHRPRGLFCAIGHCSSCLMTVDGVPNVRSCVTPIKEGMIVESQNPRGDLYENM
jgi:predicted molibdopterin-dependent oxidoreductase YjgC